MRKFYLNSLKRPIKGGESRSHTLSIVFNLEGIVLNLDTEVHVIWSDFGDQRRFQSVKVNTMWQLEKGLSHAKMACVYSIPLLFLPES